MSKYDKQIATAVRLITKYGKPVNLLQAGAAVTADPAKPWRVTGADADISTPVMMVFEAFQLQRVDGSQILRDDEQGFCPAKAVDGSDIVPARGMSVDRGDAGIWSVEHVVAVRPDDTNIMFELQLRQTVRPPAGNAPQ